MTTDRTRVRFADFDGDGRADYNIVNDDGSMSTWLNRGGDFSRGWVALMGVAGGTGFGSGPCIRLADMNGDGRADYNVINDNGSITTHINNGGDNHGGWANYGQTARGLTTDQNAVTLTDVTGEGMADYLVTNTDNSVHAYSNNGGDGHGGWNDMGHHRHRRLTRSLPASTLEPSTAPPVGGMPLQPRRHDQPLRQLRRICPWRPNGQGQPPPVLSPDPEGPA
ncbi:VCBS repeat-containing protein [Actinomadura logoneensis]|uniref:VCBS repeat-containing protein n=1 Tax=Actinomadura logoneensis TaxID=2293572 RepID=A0A372JAH0_9ACTN|nr:VCBS repeat-containing protein [Actinomadura logoneensis]